MEREKRMKTWVFIQFVAMLTNGQVSGNQPGLANVVVLLFTTPYVSFPRSFDPNKPPIFRSNIKEGFLGPDTITRQV